ncbi:MAG: hypothetical protein V4616_13620 [Bacteroidota bacterium]
MRKIHAFVAILVIFLVVSCDKDKRYLTEEEVAAFESTANPVVKDIVYIYQNEVYLLDNPDGTPRKLTKSGFGKYQPRISPDHSKVAFLDSLANCHVIGISDTSIHSVYPKFYVTNDYDWNPNPNPAMSDGLFRLFEDSVYFTDVRLDMPQENLAEGNEIHALTFDPSGNMFFLLTEDDDPEGIMKLYKWQKIKGRTGKYFVMSTDEPIFKSQYVNLSCSQNGDLLLKVASDPASPVVDAYYVYPAGQIKSSIRKQQTGIVDVWYNGSSKQAVVYGFNPVTQKIQFTVKNFQGYARSVDRNVNPVTVKGVSSFNFK